MPLTLEEVSVCRSHARTQTGARTDALLPQTSGSTQHRGFYTSATVSSRTDDRVHVLIRKAPTGRNAGHRCVQQASRASGGWGHRPPISLPSSFPRLGHPYRDWLDWLWLRSTRINNDGSAKETEQNTPTWPSKGTSSSPLLPSSSSILLVTTTMTVTNSRPKWASEHRRRARTSSKSSSR